MLNRVKNDNTGSFTIEAALIISAVLFVLFTLIFSFMLMHQKALLTKTASLAAQQGAEIWVDSRKTIESGSWNPQEKPDSMYYRLFNDSLFNMGNKPYEVTIDVSPENLQKQYEIAKNVQRSNIRHKKTAEITRAVYKELGKGLLKPDTTVLKIDYNNVLIERKIAVTLVQEVKVPFGKLKEFFSGKQTLTLKATGIAVVTQPTDYIRNIDLCLEYADRIKPDFSIENLLDKLKNSFKTN